MEDLREAIEIEVEGSVCEVIEAYELKWSEMI